MGVCTADWAVWVGSICVFVFHPCLCRLIRIVCCCHSQAVCFAVASLNSVICLVACASDVRRAASLVGEVWTSSSSDCGVTRSTHCSPDRALLLASSPVPPEYTPMSLSTSSSSHTLADDPIPDPPVLIKLVAYDLVSRARLPPPPPLRHCLQADPLLDALRFAAPAIPPEQPAQLCRSGDLSYGGRGGAAGGGEEQGALGEEGGGVGVRGASGGGQDGSVCAAGWDGGEEDGMSRVAERWQRCVS